MINVYLSGDIYEKYDINFFIVNILFVKQPSPRIELDLFATCITLTHTCMSRTSYKSGILLHFYTACLNDVVSFK